MTNENLVKLIQENKQDDLLMELWERNNRLIEKLVSKYAFNGNEAEDLKQEAFISFTAAVRTFDINSNTKFSTYLVTVVERAIRQYINTNGSSLLPQSLRQHIAEIESFIDDFVRKYHRKPKEAEIEKLTGYSERDIKKYRLYRSMNLVKSIDEPITEDKDTLGELLPSEHNSISDFENGFYAAERAAAVNKAVGELPSIQHDIVKLKYWDNETDKSTAALLNVSEIDIKRNYRQALKQLRSNAELEAFYYGDLRSRAMRGVSFRSFDRSWTSATEREALRL